MKKPVVFMYSGQGSHYYRMGNRLYIQSKKFKRWMDYCDRIVNDVGGFSLIETLYGKGDSKDEFVDSVKSAAAIVSLQYSLSQVLIENDILPDVLLGYSLGETTSAIVSGALSLDRGLEYTIMHSKLIEENTDKSKMLAVIESPDLFHIKKEVFNKCWLACTNFSRNFVVNGKFCDMLNIEKNLRENGWLFQEVPVRVGYHTPLIDPAEGRFKEAFGRYQFSPIHMEIYSSQIADRLHAYSVDHLWNVARQPVRFWELAKRLLCSSSSIFVDVGPSGTMSTFVKYCSENIEGFYNFELMNRFGKDVELMERFKSEFEQIKLSNIF